MRKRRTTTEIPGFVEDPKKGALLALSTYEDCVAMLAALGEGLAELDEDERRFLRYLAKQGVVEKP